MIPLGTNSRLVISLTVGELPTTDPISEENVSPQLQHSAPRTATLSHDAV